MRGGETRDGGGVEPGATWLHTNIKDPCTSALKGTGAQDRKVGIGAHTENIQNMLVLCFREKERKRVDDVHVSTFDHKQ